MAYLIALTLLLAPAYIWKSNIGGLPVNFLMLWVVGVWVVFLGGLSLKSKIKSVTQNSRLYHSTTLLLYFFTILFFLSGLISLFVNGFSQGKIGQFVVLFVQPISIFLIAKYIWRSQVPNYKSQTNLNDKIPDTNQTVFSGLIKDQKFSPKADLPLAERIKDLSWLIVYSQLLIVAVLGIYSIIQYFTLLGVPPMWWGNSEEPKRALAVFLHPNFYALFATPLLAFLLPSVLKFQIEGNKFQTNSKSESPNSKRTSMTGLIKDKGAEFKDWLIHGQSLIVNCLSITAWLLGALGLFLSLSRGGWLGLVAATVFYLIIAGNRKLIKFASVMVIVTVIVIAAVPNFRYRILLPFYGEKSAVSRVSLWETGWKQIKDAPVLGQGLLGFSNNWKEYNTDPNLDHHPTPHNLYLALWVDTGFLGLISFLGLCAVAIWRGIKSRRNVLQLGLALAVISLLAHGLVDTPYMKNDLAMMFWILMVFI